MDSLLYQKVRRQQANVREHITDTEFRERQSLRLVDTLRQYDLPVSDQPWYYPYSGPDRLFSTN